MGMRQVLGDGNAKAAMREDKDGRWVILLLDYENKYYQLDKGFSAADFPPLETAGFRPAADNIAQNVLLYRNMETQAADPKPDQTTATATAAQPGAPAQD